MEVFRTMYRVLLDEDARRELIRRAHHPKTKPRTRDRLEMLGLSDAGWSIPKIARHMHQHEQTVRHWIKVFLLEGFDALIAVPRPGKPSAITPEILAQVRGWIEKGDRIWSASQIAEEVDRVYGIRRSLDQWRRLLHRQRLAFKRTSRHLKHKQDPEQVAKKKAQLEALQKRGTQKRSMSAPGMKPVLR
jgi:transposase